MKGKSHYIVRNSKIHGKGVFARNALRKGTKIIEYTGPIISTEEADEIGTASVGGHTHTMLFTVDDDRVINGNEGGDAKFINHSCDPNAEAVQYGDQIFIEALRAIPKGQEITYDYHLQVYGKITDKVKKEYECFCGSPKCRGTQIAQEILDKAAKKEEKKRLKKEAKTNKKDKAKAKAKDKVKDEAKANADAKNKDKAKAKTNEKAKAKPKNEANVKADEKSKDKKKKKNKAGSNGTPSAPDAKKDKKKKKKNGVSASNAIPAQEVKKDKKKKKKKKKKASAA